MSKLTHIQRFRFTQNDLLLFDEFKEKQSKYKLIYTQGIQRKNRT